MKHHHYSPLFMVNKWSSPHLLHSASLGPSVSVPVWILGAGTSKIQWWNVLEWNATHPFGSREMKVSSNPSCSGGQKKWDVSFFWLWIRTNNIFTYYIHYLDLFENLNMAPSLRISQYNTSHGHSFEYTYHVQTQHHADLTIRETIPIALS